MSDGSGYLVADIGGTNARFAVARSTGAGAFTLERQQRMRGADFARLEDAVRAYLDGCGCAGEIRSACFGVAGPIARGPTASGASGEVRLTNSSWRFDPVALARDLRLERIEVVNDFAALARGAPLLPEKDLAVVVKGAPDPTAPIVVLGPGTGLGVGLLVPTPMGPQVVSTEGGHAAFAPRDDRERLISDALARIHGYVSWERVLSGAGLADIYAALSEAEGLGPARLTPGEVTEAALRKDDAIAVAAVDAFCAALGGFASDVAVITGARGGVFLGGGILPRIVDLLTASDFAARFRAKGPMSGYVADVPVKLILSDAAALLGAAAIATERDRRISPPPAGG